MNDNLHKILNTQWSTTSVNASASSLAIPVIVCAIDDNYAMSAAAMLNSLEANLVQYEQVRVIVLHAGLSTNLRGRIVASINPDRLLLEWFKVDDSEVRVLVTGGHVSSATYYRLLIETSFPNLSKLIYLDSDMIVLADIAGLWTVPLGDTHLSAAAQISAVASLAGSPKGLRTYKDLGIDPSCKLFNAGVLLMNVDLWKRDNISAQVLRYLKQYEDRVLWWDQDGLNAILHDKWRALNPKWNVMTSVFRHFDTWKESPFSRYEYYDIITNPYIVHYNSALKPWQTGYNLPFRDTFFKYVDRTAWCGWRP